MIYHISFPFLGFVRSPRLCKLNQEFPSDGFHLRSLLSLFPIVFISCKYAQCKKASMNTAENHFTVLIYVY